MDAHDKGNTSNAIKIMADKKVAERRCVLTGEVVFMAFPSFPIEVGCNVLSRYH
jgi:hypothetical protein